MITLDRSFVRAHLPRRPDDAHKGTMGTLCSVTGRYGSAGAAILSGRAALRSGVGLHDQILPAPIYPVYAGAVPESVCIPVQGSESGTVSAEDIPVILSAASRSAAVLIGCGSGNCDGVRAVLEALITGCEAPLIIDADGINVLSAHIDILKERRAPVILTPHVKEFSRLTGLPTAQITARQEEAAAAFAAQHPGVVLVLKSHRTVIAQDERLYLNTAGNSGMAKGGSGDVLAGIIASLTAQGLDPLSAAASGVHIHALAGDIAAERLGRTAMLPSDMIDCLSEVFTSLQ